MGHVALPISQQLVKNEMVAGIRVKGEPDEVLGCPTCMQAKFTRYPFSSSEATAKAPLDEVVMDVVGPLKLGAAGVEYFLTIVDVYTRMTWVYVLSKKSDVAETVKTDWLPMVERQQDRLVKAIRTDRGGEFLSKEFSLWLKKNGIRHSLTMPYSPAMNGIAERANRTITETARRLLIEAGLPDYFWPDAVRSACVAKNRALNHVGADKWVPYVEWIGRNPKVDMLRVFGCMCMALVPKHLRHNKLGAKAIWAVHLGMAQNSKGWLLWDPFTKKFLAPRQWYLKLRGVLEEIGFTPSTADHSLFMLGEGEQRSFMVVYVDDILIFSPSSDLVKEVMLKLQDKFKCKVLGDVSFYLGLHIERDVEKRCMRVHQRKYLEALAANFGQSEGHVATPFPSGFKCVKGPEEESVGEEERRRFHSLVGSLMYAAVNTRPDVAFATRQLARVVQCPNEEQVTAGMRVAKYLDQTATVGLQFSAAAQRRQKGANGVEPGRLFLTAFSDASYASEPEDMTSVGGFICCVGGGPTAWEGKKQVDQALSSVESVYMALFRASEGVESGGAEPQGANSSGVSAGASPRLSPQQLREWLVRRACLRSGALEAGGAGDTGAGGAGVTPGAGGTGGTAATGPGGARTRGAGHAGTGGVGGAGAGDPTECGAAGAGGSCAGGAGTGGAGDGGAGVGGTGTRGAGTAGAGAVDPGAGGATGTPASPLPAPSPYTKHSGGLTEHREPASHSVLPVRTAPRVPCSCTPPVPGTHAMALRPSSVPLHVPLPAPPESSLPEVPDPESDRTHAASTTVSRLLATAVNDPSFESAAASALVAELLDFAAACCLDYATALVAESTSASPPSVGGECALGTDVLEDRQEDFECLAATVPHFASMLLAPEGDPDAPDIPTPRSYAESITNPWSSQWQAAMDTEMASWKSTGTFVNEVPPPGANIAPRKRHGTLRTKLAALGFAPSTADLSLILRTDTLLLPFYVLVSPGTDRGAPSGSSALWLLVLLATADSSVYRPSLSAPPSDESVEPSGPYPVLVDCLMYLMTCTRPELAYPLSLLARYVAPGRHQKVHWDAAKRVLRYLCSTSGMGLVLGGRGPVVLIGHAEASWVDDSTTQRSSQHYTFSLGSGSVSWRSTRLSSVLSSCCEAENYTGAMAAQELCWLTYLLTDLGEQPYSPPVLYVDNKAMIALCQDHILEHRTKHIALR
ncbi:unnamed protein product [Closterium sp. NIES-54]